MFFYLKWFLETKNSDFLAKPTWYLQVEPRKSRSHVLTDCPCCFPSLFLCIFYICYFLYLKLIQIQFFQLKSPPRSKNPDILAQFGQKHKYFKKSPALNWPRTSNKIALFSLYVSCTPNCTHTPQKDFAIPQKISLMDTIHSFNSEPSLKKFQWFKVCHFTLSVSDPPGNVVCSAYKRQCACSKGLRIDTK